MSPFKFAGACAAFIALIVAALVLAVCRGVNILDDPATADLHDE